MSIYEAMGVTNRLLYLYDDKPSEQLSAEPFEYVAKFPALEVPEGMDIEKFKKNHAPYCISGKVKKDKDDAYRRNDTNLIYRDLIFLDYDNITLSSEEFKATVERAIGDYSYIIYPTIKHTEEKPRFRLVVKPSEPMNKETYKSVVAEIAEKIGLMYDTASLTWSQLQGLPVTVGKSDDYVKTVHRGKDYPVPKYEASTIKKASTNGYTIRSPNERKSPTVRIIETLFNGFGEEGGRNNACASFVGLLFNRYVNFDIATAYQLTVMANNNTPEPLPEEELDRTFGSIAKKEYSTRL
ncbi:primase C-terminal domain-containing protein [Streptococcus alactolyticus]|uniref:primase alpha helix C-terminal domain-containing protein n=1 Tax=Streptococcus alactolyticus TaxID=29389 RepID=UPI001959106C|nr:primase alpha helix C-terminal domain-containing protein [Streptococcus alactolyticus]MBM6697924.1 primase C-terminal domain-containing protein [Streptococcus alactolyticus]